MVNNKENVTESAAESSVKRVRRGISNETKATAQLSFHEKDARPNGLFVAALYNVSVAWSQAENDGKQFAGEKVPRLVFEFVSITADASARRHAYHTLFPVESNVNTIPGGSEEWKVNQIMTFIKHILDVYYLKGRKLTPEEEDALVLPLDDIDDEGNFVPLEAKDILAAYATLFNNVAAIMNGSFNLPEGETPKPCYRDANGKVIQAWIKLLRHKKVRGEWKNVGRNGELAFDPFVGTGVVELYVNGKEPSIISVDPSRESITPKETKKATEIPGMINGGIAVGAGMPGANVMANPAFNEASTGDMPF
jgi:hypothetical protein